MITEIKHFESFLRWGIQQLETGYRVEIFDKEFYDGGYRSERGYYSFIDNDKAPNIVAALIIALKDVKLHSLHPAAIQRAIEAQYKRTDSQLSLAFDG